jgi:hypothetical protein
MIDDVPSPTGIAKYPPNGHYEWSPCTCKPTCADDCKGQCGCQACSFAYHDAIEYD